MHSLPYVSVGLQSSPVARNWLGTGPRESGRPSKAAHRTFHGFVTDPKCQLVLIIPGVLSTRLLDGSAQASILQLGYHLHWRNRVRLHAFRSFHFLEISFPIDPIDKRKTFEDAHWKLAGRRHRSDPACGTSRTSRGRSPGSFLSKGGQKTVLDIQGACFSVCWWTTRTTTFGSSPNYTKENGFSVACDFELDLTTA